jgi:hypothetical protein
MDGGDFIVSVGAKHRLCIALVDATARRSTITEL